MTSQTNLEISNSQNHTIKQLDQELAQNLLQFIEQKESQKNLLSRLIQQQDIKLSEYNYISFQVQQGFLEDTGQIKEMEQECTNFKEVLNKLMRLYSQTVQQYEAYKLEIQEISEMAMRRELESAIRSEIACYNYFIQQKQDYLDNLIDFDQLKCLCLDTKIQEELQEKDEEQQQINCVFNNQNAHILNEFQQNSQQQIVQEEHFNSIISFNQNDYTDDLIMNRMFKDVQNYEIVFQQFKSYLIVQDKFTEKQIIQSIMNNLNDCQFGTTQQNLCEKFINDCIQIENISDKFKYKLITKVQDALQKLQEYNKQSKYSNTKNSIINKIENTIQEIFMKSCNILQQKQENPATKSFKAIHSLRMIKPKMEQKSSSINCLDQIQIELHNT